MVEAGIPLAAGDAVNEQSYSIHNLIKNPHVLKVRRGGSSIGTYLVHDPSEVDNREVAKVFELDQEAIIEELVIGTEITVPILGDIALPVIEIIPPNHQDFDYENKYNGKTQELCPPISITKEIQIKAQELSLKVHKSLGCRHWSRVDIIVRPDGSMVVLELNTIPGMTEQSLYPKSAAVHGLSMPDLMKEFVRLVNN
jgi:D-alanine-D-alanine ligase